MIYDKPPFELGETLSGTDDNGNLINKEWLGAIFWFPAKPYRISGPGEIVRRRTGRPIKAMICRNTSGTTLYGKRLGQLDTATTAGHGACNEVTGYTVANTDKNFIIIDEFLASVGVADDDLFWGILEGPVIVRSQTLAAAGSVIAKGAKVVVGTGAGTATNTTAGGVAMTTTCYVDQIVGTALSAQTTADTGTDLLINASIYSW